MTKYYGKKEQRQEALIELVNRTGEPIKSIKGGMCYMLSLNWIIRCLAHSPFDYKNPIKEFDRMTNSNNICELRQIAYNFNAYVGDVLGFNLGKDAFLSPEWVRGVCGQSDTFVKMLSRNKLTAVPHLLGAKLDPMTNQLRNLTIQPGTEAYLILFYFEDKHKLYGHAIAMVSANHSNGQVYYTYDPNIGVCIDRKIQGLTEVLKFYGKQDLSKVTAYIIAVR